MCGEEGGPSPQQFNFFVISPDRAAAGAAAADGGQRLNYDALGAAQLLD